MPGSSICILSGESMTTPVSGAGAGAGCCACGSSTLPALPFQVVTGLLVALALDPDPRRLLAVIPCGVPELIDSLSRTEPAEPPCRLTTGSSMVKSTPVFMAISFNLVRTSGIIVFGERPVCLEDEGKRAESEYT